MDPQEPRNELTICEKQFKDQHRECIGYYCHDPVLSGFGNERTLSTQNLSADNSRCDLKWYPFAPAREAQYPEMTAKPMTYDGVPIDAQMDSFKQPFEVCEWDQDVGNKAMKARNLWNERGTVELSPIPEYKPCGPSAVNITRKGMPVNRDGIVNTAENLRNPDKESDLLNLSRTLVQGDTSVRGLNGQYCVEKTLKARHRITPQLDLQYSQTTVDPQLFKRQLFTDYDTEKNRSWKAPHLFRNSTKAKISV